MFGTLVKAYPQLAPNLDRRFSIHLGCGPDKSITGGRPGIDTYRWQRRV